MTEYENDYNTDVSTDTTTQADTTTPPVTNVNEPTAGMTATGQRLRAYIDRLERLDEDKQGISEDIKEVFAEAKGDGFDVKAIRKILSMRKKDPEERAEEEAIIETYMAAMGMR